MFLAAAAARAQNASEFYRRGLDSTLSYRKIMYFTKALQLDPDYVPAYEKRAIHYFFQGQFDKAIADYSRVIDLKAQPANAYLRRGLAHLKKAHGEGMMAEINRLVHRHYQPEVPENQGLLEKAVDDFTSAVDFEPQMAKAFSYRAEANRLMGLTDRAVRDANRAIQLAGDTRSTAHAYHVLSLVYRQLGKNDLYEAAYANYVQLDPYAPDYPPLNVPLVLKSYIPNAESVELVRRLGLYGIIIIAFALIFQVHLRAPRKKE